MASYSVDQFASLINRQIKLQTEIQDYLVKINAIATVTTGDDFLDWDQSTIHDYLWALSDMICESKDLQEQALNDLLQGSMQYWFPTVEMRAGHTTG